MNLIFWKKSQPVCPFPSSELFDEKDFYQSFVSDLLKTREEVIIESPFITTRRVGILLPIFQKLLQKGIKIHIVTRKPEQHDEFLRVQAEIEINNLENMGIDIIFYDGYHHRKIAIIDRDVLWEGSLNILSYSYSGEVMRRIQSEQESQRMFSFLHLESVI